MSARKKTLLILFMFVMLLGLYACSGGGQKQPAVDAVKEPGNQTTVPAQENTDDDSDESQEGGAAQPNISVGDAAGKSAELPNGYPSELFPIYKDSYIVSAVELDGSYTIAAFSKDDFQDVAAYYKDILKNATVTYETELNTGFTSFGTIDNFTYNFDTGESSEIDGYVTSIAIMLMPAE